MSLTQWLLVIGLVLFLWAGALTIRELRALRALLAEINGSIAQALWRIRDELAEGKKVNP